MNDLEIMRGLLHLRNELDKLIESHDKKTEPKEFEPQPDLWASNGTGQVEQSVVHSIT